MKKTMTIFTLMLVLLTSFVLADGVDFAKEPTLESPADNTVDKDGQVTFEATIPDGRNISECRLNFVISPYIISDSLAMSDTANDNETWSLDLNLPKSDATYTWNVICGNTTNSTTQLTSNVTRTLKVDIGTNVAGAIIAVNKQAEKSRGSSKVVWLAAILLLGYMFKGKLGFGKKK